jgi:hypothetical protein
MSESNDLPANFSASPSAELFGGIRPEAPVTPSPEVTEVSSTARPRKARQTQPSKDPVELTTSNESDPATDETSGLTDVPVGRYLLCRGALALPLVEDEDGTWQDAFLVKVLQDVGVSHRHGLRLPVPGFYLEGRWTVVEGLNLPILVRVDDLTPAGKSEGP